MCTDIQNLQGDFFYFLPKVKANNFGDNQYFLMQFFASSSESSKVFIVM